MAEKSAKSQAPSSTLAPQTVTVSRRSVTLLAGLIPLIVTVAFLFGLMVGNFTANPKLDVAELRMSSVKIQLGRIETPAPVAMLLPVEWKGTQKFDPQLILPDSFKPLDNPTIDGIVQAGGAISRVPESGATLTVPANASYWLVILHPTTTKTVQLDRQQTAGLAQYFLPLDDLIHAGDLHIELIRLSEHPKSVRVN